MYLKNFVADYYHSYFLLMLGEGVIFLTQEFEMNVLKNQCARKFTQEVPAHQSICLMSR